MHRHAVATAHALFALLLGGANALAQPPQYTVQDLGTSTSSLSITVTGINRNGEVVGYAGGSSSPTLAFRTQPNSPINLPADYIGTLGGSGNCGNSPCSSVATGINSSGQVVGYSTTSSGEIHGFRTAAHAAINAATDDLGSLGGPPTSNNFLTRAMGINDAGQVVGLSQTSDGSAQAFRTAANAAINPATDNIEPHTGPGTTTNSEARNINNSGDVLGDYHDTALSDYRFFVAYHDGTFVDGPGSISVETSKTNINDSDQVGGSNTNALGVWQNGAGLALATCANVQDCPLRSLNNSLQMVGQLYSPSAPQRAFLFMGGAVYDLNTLIPTNSGWVLTDAVAINDNGQIIGTGTLNGVTHVVRLDPSKPPFTYSMSAAASISVPQGGSTADNITLTLSSGTPGPVSFTTSPLPANLAVTFSATTCTPTCTTTMTVSALADASTGTSNFMVFANSPGFSANIFMTVTITTPSGGAGFSWSLTEQTQSLSVNQGNSVSDLLTATLKSGTPDVITFRTTSTLPPGVNVTFSPAACTPNCTTTMTITTSSPTTPPGTYFIDIDGTCGCSAAGTAVQLQVNGGGDTATGLVGWWKLNDGSGNTAADSSGSGNNATLYNPSWWTSNYGVTNLFNGSTSYGFVSESSSLEMTNQLTVAFWVRPTNNSSPDQRILNKIYDWDVKLTPQNDPQFDANGHYFQLNYALPANTWNHVAFTFNNGTVTGYVNGQAQSTVANTFTGSGSLLTWAYGLYLAAYDSTPSNAFAGSLNDLRIYNRALSASDITALYGYLPGQSSFTFSLSAAQSSISVSPGSSVTDNITASLSSGTPAALNFTASGLPSGADAHFASCTPTCTVQMLINTSSSTAPGTYKVTVTASGGGSSASTTVNVTIGSGGFGPSITKVQSASAEGSGVASLSVPFGSANTKGNLIIAFVRMSTTAQTVSVSDTAGNVYTDAVAQAQNNDGHQVHIFYAANVVGGANTVLATFSGTNNHPFLAIYEYNGPVTLDQTAAAQGYGSAPSSGATPGTRSTNELVFGAIGLPASYTGTATAASGFTLEAQDTGTSRAANEDQIVAATGSYAATFSLSSSAEWAAVVATFAAPRSGPRITTTGLPTGTRNYPYTFTLTATGGTTPYTWSITRGALPAGLTLDPSTGTISGTPTATGTSSFDVFVTDSNGMTPEGAVTLSLTINAPPPLSITTTSLPNGTQNTAYNTGLLVNGGLSPYNWSLTTGTLPAGISLNNSTGAISGTPTASGTSNFTVQVTDATAQTATRALSITINPSGGGGSSPTITTTSLPDGTQNAAYGVTLDATGGTTPYSWTISTGTLPFGLRLNPSTGTISGRPGLQGVGTSSFSVQVTDANGQKATQNLSITIHSDGTNGQITLLQSKAVEGSGVPSVSVAFPAPNTLNNFIIAFVRMSTTTQTVSISDSAGNQYVDALGAIAQPNDGHQIHVFYAPFVAAGTNTVTATFSGTNNHPFLAIYEYSGLNSFDTGSAAYGWGTSPFADASPLTTTVNDLAFVGTGLPASYTGTVNAGSGFTLQQQDTGTSRAANEAQVTLTPGSGGFTLSDSANWSAILAVFHP